MPPGVSTSCVRVSSGNTRASARALTGVISIRRDGPIRVGARYEQQTAGHFGRPIAADIEVNEYVPDTRIAFRVIAGPIRPVGSYDFSGDNTTTVTLDDTLTGIKKALMASMVQKTMDTETRALD